MSKFHDDSTVASNPGNIRLSAAKLKKFKNNLPILERIFIGFRFPPAMLNEHLMLGDSRAAVVLEKNENLLVASYTDELDCVVLLKFPMEFAKRYKLAHGSRLLTVNTYFEGKFLSPDLENGEFSYNRYSNFYPLIADFLSEDIEAINERKKQIQADEWARVIELGSSKLKGKRGAVRDGSPYRSAVPNRLVRYY